MEATLKSAEEREAGVPCPHCLGRVKLADQVAACRACGTVHHTFCWQSHGGCGSYACAPINRPLNGSVPSLRLSDDDIRNAIPLPPGRPMPVAFPARLATMSVSSPTTSGLAIASLICAILGIPFFGVITGAVAVLLGSLALGEISRGRRKGMGLAVVGLILGLGDVVGWIVAIVLILGGGGGGGGHGPQPTGQQISAADLNRLPAPIAQAMRANVLIRTRQTLGEGLGSGIIMRIADGNAHVLTSRHVVDAGFEWGSARAADPASINPVWVQMLGQSSQEGRVVWLAPDGVDLALVTVPCNSQQAAAAKFPRNRIPRIGDPVFAIGNPQAWGWTHTQGVISQFRSWATGGRELNIVQTSAAISPGNSGGGLYDQDGSLLGVNTWTSDKRVSEGLGFAISLDILPDLSPPGLQYKKPAEEAIER